MIDLFLHFRRPLINVQGCDPTFSICDPACKSGKTTCKEKFNAVFFHMHNWSPVPKYNPRFPGPAGKQECGFFTYKHGSTKILGGPNLDGLTFPGCDTGGGPWGSINWIAGRPYKGNDIYNNGRTFVQASIYGAYVECISFHILFYSKSLFNCSPRTRI